jgi:hypothetical protein
VNTTVNTQMQELAKDIAAFLTGSWSAQPLDSDGDWRAYVNGANGEKLFLSNTWAGKGRIYASGILPGNRSFQDGITVTATKSAQQIARDIERRLLPVYQPALEKAKQAERDENAAEQARLATIAEVETIIELPFTADHTGKRASRYVEAGVIRVEYADRVEIERFHSVTLDQFRRIVAAVPELFKKL